MARLRGFVGQSYTLRNTSYDRQRTLNMYPEVNETQQGKAGEIAQLTSTPGLTQLISSAGAGGRCLYVAGDNKLYYATSAALYRIDGNYTSSGWTKTLLTNYTTTGPVFMTDNGTHLFLVSDGGGITYDLNTTAVAVISGVSPSACTFLDGYVVMTDKDTNQFYWTDLYSTTVDPLNFATAEANTDRLLHVLNNNEDLWLFGEKTIELWYNAAGISSSSNVTFARRTNVLIETGLAAIGSVCKLNMNRLVFMSQDDRGGPVVTMTDGYTPKRISTFAVEQALNAATAGTGGIASSTAYVYTQDGHTFYCLNVPGLTSTWVYDVTTSEQLGVPTWHERQTTGARNLAEGHAFFKNKHIVSDYSTGAVYFIDQDNYTDNGATITRQRVCPHMVEDFKRIFYNWVQLDMLVAQGSVSYPNPTVTLEYSNDGGNTWNTPTTRGTGKAGVGQSYNTRVIFNRLGQGRDRVFRVTMTDPVFWAISGASYEAVKGMY